jgi:dolichol kinase
MRSMLRRRSWHLSAGLCIAFAAWFLPTTAMLISLGLVTFVFLAFEFIRLKVPSVNRWFFSHFGSLLREEETSRVTASSYVLVAALMAYLAFGRDIAVLSVCFLAVGDVAAGIVGRYIGRTRLFGKALEGDLACFMACLAAGFALHYAGLDIGLVTILVGSIGATIGQAIRNPVDDNLTLPLFAGAVMAAIP